MDLEDDDEAKYEIEILKDSRKYEMKSMNIQAGCWILKLMMKIK